MQRQTDRQTDNSDDIICLGEVKLHLFTSWSSCAIMWLSASCLHMDSLQVVSYDIVKYVCWSVIMPCWLQHVWLTHWPTHWCATSSPISTHNSQYFANMICNASLHLHAQTSAVDKRVTVDIVHDKLPVIGSHATSVASCQQAVDCTCDTALRTTSCNSAATADTHTDRHSWHTHRQTQLTHTQTDRHRHIHTDRQTDRHTQLTHTQTDRHRHIHTDRHTQLTYTQTDRHSWHTHRQTDTADTHTDRQTHTHTQTDRHSLHTQLTYTHRQTDRQTYTQTQQVSLNNVTQALNIATFHSYNSIMFWTPSMMTAIACVNTHRPLECPSMFSNSNMTRLLSWFRGKASFTQTLS